MATHNFRRGTPDEAIKSGIESRKYFYLDGKLYRQLTVIRGQDIMRVWSYEDSAIVQLPLSYVKSRRKPSYTTTQVAAMLNRSRMNINHLYMMGVVPAPKKSVPTKPNSKHPGRYRLSEDDVYRLHNYYAHSRQRKLYDSSSKPLPSRRELATMMKYEKITYVQDKEGNFVPIWNAPDTAEWL